MEDQENKRRQLAQALDRLDAQRKTADLRDPVALHAVAAEIKRLMREVEALELPAGARRRRGDFPGPEQ